MDVDDYDSGRLRSVQKKLRTSTAQDSSSEDDAIEEN